MTRLKEKKFSTQHYKWLQEKVEFFWFIQAGLENKLRRQIFNCVHLIPKFEVSYSPSPSKFFWYNIGQCPCFCLKEKIERVALYFRSQTLPDLWNVNWDPRNRRNKVGKICLVHSNEWMNFRILNADTLKCSKEHAICFTQVMLQVRQQVCYVAYLMEVSWGNYSSEA